MNQIDLLMGWPRSILSRGLMDRSTSGIIDITSRQITQLTPRQRICFQCPSVTCHGVGSPLCPIYQKRKRHG